jgi:hypothetical protein
MKKLALVLAAATLVLGAVCLVQWGQLDHRQNQLVSLKGEMEQTSKQLETLQALQQRSENQKQALLRQADELAAQLQARQAAESNTAALAATNPPAAPESEKADKDTGGFGKFLSKMMEDPNTKKFIRDQQRQMMDQLYSPLVKQMGLGPEEADKFKDLLADNMMKGAEKASSLFGGLSSTNRAELASTMAAEQKNFDEQVKAFLGDVRYAQYKDYQQTAGERTQLNLFKQQTAGNDNPLSDQQTEQLLAFMKEEKQNVAATTGQPLSGTGQNEANLQAMLSDDQTEKLLQSQETVNQRVYERARAVLAPDQLDAFAKFQTNQLQMMRMGMGMMKTMFGPDKPSGGATSPGQ